MAILIATLLTFSMAVSPLILPSVNATTNVGTNAWVVATPDPVGVGQKTILGMGLVQVNPLSQLLTTSTVSNVWNNYKLSITDPNGATSSAGPFSADYTAGASYAFTPTIVGNYTITFSFPGQLVNANGFDQYYGPSNSTITLTVQQQPIYALPLNPLPTDYWARPINWQNVLWWQISGNWLGIQSWTESTGSVNPYTIAPATAHIMWTKPLEFGGQIGGGSPYNQTETSNYYTGKSYQWPFTPPVIINGVLYYNSPSNIAPDYGFYAVDLRTGQTLWYNNGTNQSPTNPTSYGGFTLPVTHWPGITYGQVYTYHNPNEVGGIPYLWGVSGSTYSLFDANTGRWILNVVNSPGGTAIIDPQSELLVYTLHAINNTYGWLAMWNSTKCLGSSGFAVDSIEFRPPPGATLQWSTGVQWNVTVPLYPYSLPASGSVAIGGVDDGVILVLGTEQVLPGLIYQPQNYQCEAGYSATTGQFLWDANRTIGMGPETSQLRMEAMADGVYTEHNKEDNTYYGFSIHTGQQLWGPIAGSSYSWDLYTRNSATSNGIVYFLGPESIQAMSLTNGTFLWDFAAPTAGLQETAPTYLFEGEYGLCTGGGDVFVSSSSSHGDILFRGAKLYAVNATTGKEQWSIDGFFIGKCFALADGYLVDYNAYDNQIYSFGQGPTKTTVTAPNVGVTTATPITISGTVTDISAGASQQAVAANFPNGLPAVSDASMSQFMAAVYEQQQMPHNVTGVPVTISVTDSNGNYRDIGTTTSNAYGAYSFTWTPDISGNYEVTATFTGSGAYYPSSAATGFYASESVATASPAPTAAPSMADQYILPGIIGIIVAIAIGFAVTILVLRKRP